MNVIGYTTKVFVFKKFILALTLPIPIMNCEQPTM
jgi:hypothetical protein